MSAMYVLNTDVFYVTSAGLEALQQLLADKQKEYAQVCEYRQQAFEMSGDGWHDNPEFNRMQQLEANLNHSVKALGHRLQHTRCYEIEEGQRPMTEVALGAVVQIKRWPENAAKPLIEAWEIIGYDQTDLNHRQLGYNAPLAQAILGLHAGDFADEFTVNGRVWDIEVVSLFPSRQAAGLASGLRQAG